MQNIRWIDSQILNQGPSTAQVERNPWAPTAVGTGWALSAAVLLAVILLVTVVSSASAGQVLKFKETLGSGNQPTFVNPTALAVDGTGDLLVMDKGAGTISRFKPDGEPDDFSALGTNVISATPEGPLKFTSASETQIAVDTSGGPTNGDIYVTDGTPPKAIDIFAGSGDYLGRLTEADGKPYQEVCGVAADPDGNVYIGEFITGMAKYAPTSNPVDNGDWVATFTPKNRCTVAAGTGPTATSFFTATAFGAPFKQSAVDGTVEYQVGTEPVTTETVDPSSGNLLIASREKVVEYDAASPNGATKVTTIARGSSLQGIAAGQNGLVYVSRAGISDIEVLQHVPTPAVTADPTSDITRTTATLNGTVGPEEISLTGCEFEYGLVTSNTLDQRAECQPPGPAIPADSDQHSVSAPIESLQPNSDYRVRLVATNQNGSTSSETVTFRTQGKPVITEVHARDATQTSAVLEATIDPFGFDTTYVIEWGTTTSYGRTAARGMVAAAGGATHVAGEISGLEPGATYHYRVMATSGGGDAEGTDHELETLGTCGLPETRCFELVSPRDAGPVDLPGVRSGQVELHYQAAANSGELAYVSETGPPNATKGGEILAKGVRGPGGWSSAQLSPPITAVTQGGDGSSASSRFFVLNEDLTCGVVSSNQPLTGDASTRAVVEAGGSNLYRQNPDGGYTAITRLPAENPGAGQALPNSFTVEAVSNDCGKVIFRSAYRYPGVPSIGPSPLYEWDEGALHSLGYVPGLAGESLEEASMSTLSPRGGVREFGSSCNEHRVSRR